MQYQTTSPYTHDQLTPTNQNNKITPTLTKIAQRKPSTPTTMSKTTFNTPKTTFRADQPTTPVHRTLKFSKTNLTPKTPSNNIPQPNNNSPCIKNSLISNTKEFLSAEEKICAHCGQAGHQRKSHRSCPFNHKNIQNKPTLNLTTEEKQPKCKSCGSSEHK
jgi:hypothetical protein